MLSILNLVEQSRNALCPWKRLKCSVSTFVMTQTVTFNGHPAVTLFCEAVLNLYWSHRNSLDGESEETLPLRFEAHFLLPGVGCGVVFWCYPVLWQQEGEHVMRVPPGVRLRPPTSRRVLYHLLKHNTTNYIIQHKSNSGGQGRWVSLSLFSQGLTEFRRNWHIVVWQSSSLVK